MGMRSRWGRGMLRFCRIVCGILILFKWGSWGLDGRKGKGKEGKGEKINGEKRREKTSADILV